MVIVVHSPIQQEYSTGEILVLQHDVADPKHDYMRNKYAAEKGNRWQRDFWSDDMTRVNAGSNLHHCVSVRPNGGISLGDSEMRFPYQTVLETYPGFSDLIKRQKPARGLMEDPRYFKPSVYYLPP